MAPASSCVGLVAVIEAKETALGVARQRTVTQLENLFEFVDVALPHRHALRSGQFCFRQIRSAGKGELMQAFLANPQPQSL